MKLPAIFVAVVCCVQAQYSISTLSGTTGPAFGTQATSAYVPNPVGVAWDSTGRLYFSSQNTNQVYRINLGGTIDMIIGNGHAGSEGDGGFAIGAGVKLKAPGALAVDSNDNLYIIESYSCVRKVDAVTGRINTVAGIPGNFGPSQDGVLATNTTTRPNSIAVDSAGNLFLGETSRIRKVAASTRIVTTVAGTGTAGNTGDGGQATLAQIWATGGIALDRSGNVYLADIQNNIVRKVTVSTGSISTIAGTGAQGNTGDYGPATGAQISGPWSIAVDGSGNLYISSYTTIRKVSPAGIITSVAGNGGIGPYAGDGGLAILATLPAVTIIAANSAGDVAIADQVNYQILKVDSTTSLVTTVAGTSSAPGDNGPAVNAQWSKPTTAAVDSLGNLYVGDVTAGRVRKISASTGIITTVAGNGTHVSTGDGGLATNAGIGLFAHSGTDVLVITLDPSDNLYFLSGDTVRKVSAKTGIVTTIAGGGQLLGANADGAPATSAYMGSATTLAADENAVYVMLQSSTEILRVDLKTGILTTTAHLPAALPVWAPVLERDKLGNFYYGANMSIFKIAAGSVDSTVLVNANPCTGYLCPTPDASGPQIGDGGLAAGANLEIPTAAKTDSVGNLYIADSGHERIRFVSANTGLVSTIGGSGGSDCSVVPGPATQAQFGGLYGLAVDSKLNVFAVDRICAKIYKLNLPAYRGYVDAVNCQTISGWAADSSRLNQSITVSIYDGATLLGTVTANASRSDVGAVLGDNGLHGFSYALPASVRDGSAHSLHVYYESTSLEAPGSPKALTCGASYTGSVDSASCSGVSGWVADRNRPNVPIVVSLWDGSTLVTSGTANLARPDVGAAIGDNGIHGFSLTIPAGYSGSHTLQVRYESSSTQVYGSPFTLTCLAANYAGYIDSSSCSGITGWAADRNRPGASITVSLWDGSTLVTSTTANALRYDVGAYLGDNGLHAFKLTLPSAYANRVSIGLQVRYEASAMQLPLSPVNLICGGSLSTTVYAGYVDSASCSGITGWAADRSRLNTPISVSLWDGATQIAAATASAVRSDVGAVLGDNGAHGFSLAIPAAYTDGVSHAFRIRYETSTSQLPGSPRTLTCGSAPNYTGSVDVLSCSSISGWAADRNSLNSSINVNVYDGSALLMTLPANGSRSDVGAYLGDNGLHAFGAAIPAPLKDGGAHTVTVRPVNSTSPLYGQQSLTCP